MSGYKEQLKKLFFGQDEPCIAEMKRRLSVLGFEVNAIRFIPSSETHMVASAADPSPCAYIGLYIKGRENVEKIRFPSGILKPEYQSGFVDIWRSVCAEAGVDMSEYCGSKPSICAHSTDAELYTYIARTRKAIPEAVIAQMCAARQKYIFVSSVPQFNIVFEEKNYLRSKIGERKDLLSGRIRELAEKALAEEFGRNDFENVLEVNFLHTKMAGINLYGLSRED